MTDEKVGPYTAEEPCQKREGEQDREEEEYLEMPHEDEVGHQNLDQSVGIGAHDADADDAEGGRRNWG